jgi:hypothetical protein
VCIQIICSNLCLHGLGMIPHLCVLLTPEQIALDGSKTVSTDCIGNSIFDGNETFPFLRGCLHPPTQAMYVVVLRPRAQQPHTSSYAIDLCRLFT